MTNEQILKKAIEKAVKGNWFHPSSGHEPITYYKEIVRNRDYLKFIFSHSFAKAFWGRDNKLLFVKDENAWNFHLQQMVLEKEPLLYLKKFLK